MSRKIKKGDISRRSCVGLRKSKHLYTCVYTTELKIKITVPQTRSQWRHRPGWDQSESQVAIIATIVKMLPNETLDLSFPFYNFILSWIFTLLSFVIYERVVWVARGCFHRNNYSWNIRERDVVASFSRSQYFKRNIHHKHDTREQTLYLISSKRSLLTSYNKNILSKITIVEG